jgi:hypothetical protein
MEQKRRCPECHLIFEAPAPESGVLTCPLCDTVFSVAPAHGSMPATSGRHVFKGCAALGVLAVFVGGLVYAAYHLTESVGSTPATAPSFAAIVPPRPEPSPIVEDPSAPPPKPAVRPPKPPPKSPTPPPKPPPPLKKTTDPPPKIVRKPLSLPERVNHAIDRGVEYLRTYDGTHQPQRNYLGLLGLTLLECGVSEKDPTVQDIANWLRMREHDLNRTYELATDILFLDRLNDPEDRPIIRTFGHRLMGGQNRWGAWSYDCPVKNKRGQRYGEPVNPKAPPRPSAMTFQGDNSNTQFAILGLWVARRHGVQAERALLAAERHFRETQLREGSWCYDSRNVASRDSMTCAALMGLAMRHGMIAGRGRDIRPDQPVEVSDKAVTQGLNFLGRSMKKIKQVGGSVVGVEARDALYYLWSLERMAVIYNLRTVGEREWYPWAAEMLVEAQKIDGSWEGRFQPLVNTCFALLVLRRSNLTPDLRLTVQGQPPAELGPTTKRGKKSPAPLPADAIPAKK